MRSFLGHVGRPDQNPVIFDRDRPGTGQHGATAPRQSLQSWRSHQRRFDTWREGSVTSDKRDAAAHSDELLGSRDALVMPGVIDDERIAAAGERTVQKEIVAGEDIWPLETPNGFERV